MCSYKETLEPVGFNSNNSKSIGKYLNGLKTFEEIGIQYTKWQLGMKLQRVKWTDEHWCDVQCYVENSIKSF